MLGTVLAVLLLVSCVAAAVNGQLTSLSAAALEGAARAVTLSVSLCGSMCLFSGVMRLFSAAGLLSRLSRFLSPLLTRVFPSAVQGGGIEEIGANLAANLLGMGNAATPFALAAMDKLQQNNPHPQVATDDMVTLVVMNTASFCLLPTTLISLRRLGHSTRAAVILLPVWIVSFLSAMTAVLLSRVLRRFFPPKEADP